MSEHDAFTHLLGVRGELAAAEEAQLQLHLESCNRCRRIAGEYNRQDAFLRSLDVPTPARPPRQDVFRQIASRPAPRTPRRRLLLLLSPVALVLAAVLVTAARSHSTGMTALAPLHHAPAYAGLDAPGSKQAARSLPRRRAATPPSVEAVPASPLVPPPQFGAASDAAFAGNALTLTLPRASYPRNALVQVTIHLRNMTRYLEQVNDFPHGCGTNNPDVTVVDDAGHARPAVPFSAHAIPAGCPFIPPARSTPGFIRPGRTLSTRVYAVLRARHLIATAQLTIYRGCDPRQGACKGRLEQLRSGMTTISLLPPGPAPRVVLHGSPPRFLTISPAHAVHSPVIFTGWYSCRAGAGQTFVAEDSSFGWVTKPASISGRAHVSLPLGGCSPAHIELHLAAGWLGRPAALVNYVRG